jgi:CRISPR-associated endonuclease Cas2
MSRGDYLVTYDISDDTRLRQVFKTMKGFGDHVQYSVFRCSLTKTEMTEMMAARKAYEIGVNTFNEGRHMFLKTLDIGRE